MPFVFKSETTIEFDSDEDMEVFIKTLPLPAHQAVELLEGGTIVDDTDQAEATGAGKTVHTFSVKEIK